MINKKILLVFISTLLLLLNINAQLLPIQTLSTGKLAVEQPAYIHDNFTKYDTPLSIDLSYRHQWIHLDYAPKTAMASIQYFSEDYNILFGGTVLNDDTSPTGLTGFQLQAGYKIKFSKDWNASLGLSGGIYQFRIATNELDFLEEEVSNIGEKTRSIYPNFNLGGMIFYDDTYFVGLSIVQTLGNNLRFGNDNTFDLNIHRHYTTSAGAILELHNDSWFEPSINLRQIANQRLFWELLMRYEVQEKFWLGAGYADSGNLHLEAGVILNFGEFYNSNIIRIGYAFNNYLNTYSTNFGSAHEIKITYSK